MKIGIVGGTGKEGSGLALRMANAGHQVMIGSRDASRGQTRAEELSEELNKTIDGGNNEDAVEYGDIIILSVPFSGHQDTLESLKESLKGKIVVDLTVPLTPPAVTSVSLPEGQAVALRAQKHLNDSTSVVAAFHHVSSANLSNIADELHTDVLVVSDDDEAKAKILELIDDMGAKGIDAGPLQNAIALESLTPVLIHINKTYGTSGSGIHITGLKDE